MSADLIYDVLRKHEPDHILLRATRAEAAFGLTDVARISSLLDRARGRISVRRLERVSPLAVPALIEEGREWVSGTAEDALLAEATSLVADATWGEDSFSGEISDGTPEPAPPPERAPRQSRSMRLARRRPRRA